MELDVTNRLLVVLDDPAARERAIRALAKLATSPDSVTVLEGSEGAHRLDRPGRRGGAGRRIARLLALMAADQSVDLATYEAALLDGRTVLAIRAPQAERRRALTRALADAGGHFINYFGRMATEDIVPWRGEHLNIPFHYHR